MPSPLRLPLTFYAGLAARYVAPYGNDNNDGYDFRYPKKTIIAAYDSLPASGGTLNVLDGSYTGGEMSQQGLLLTAKGTLYPGWRRMKTLNVVGWTGDASIAQLATTGARIYPGNPGDGAPYFPADSQFGVWFTGNGAEIGCPIVFSNIITKTLRGGWRIGGNPNPAVDPYGASGMGSDFTTALWWLNSCSTQYDGDGNAATAQPGFHIGYCIWGNMDGCDAVRPLDAEWTSDRRAGVLVKPSDGSSQVRISNQRGTQGGIKFYAGASSWGLDVDWVQIEGDFTHPLPPAVWLIGTNKFGSAVISTAGTADSGPGSMNSVVLDGLHSPSQILVTNLPSLPTGACTVLAGNESDSHNVTSIITPARNNQCGFVGGQIWGNQEFVTQVSPIISNRVYNLCPQHVDPGGETGAVAVQTELGATSNRIWTQEDVITGPTSGTCVDAEVIDKRGGTSAIQIACNDGGVALQRLFFAYRTVQVGDYFVCGVWVRFPSNPPTSGFPVGMSLTNADLGWEDHSTSLGPSYYGDGQWTYLKGWAKVTALNSVTQALVNFFVHDITAGHPIVIDQRFLAHIPAGTMSDNEFAAFFQNLVSYVQAPVGVAVTQPGQALALQGTLMVKDAFSASGHTIGALANLWPIYNAAGGLIGYAPLYPLTS